MVDRATLRYFLVLSGFVLAGFAFFSLGSYIVEKNFGDRSPAAVQRAYDYSNLEGSALKFAAAERLLNSAKVITAGSLIGVEFGNFLVKNKDGKSVSACDEYSTIEIKFYGSGIATSGEPPEMTLEGPCLTAADTNIISPFMVPYKEILGMTPEDRELGNVANSGIEIRFENVSDAWPTVWVLDGITMSNENSGTLVIERADILKILGRAFIVEWHY